MPQNIAATSLLLYRRTRIICYGFILAIKKGDPPSELHANFIKTGFKESKHRVVPVF